MQSPCPHNQHNEDYVHARIMPTPKLLLSFTYPIVKIVSTGRVGARLPALDLAILGYVRDSKLGSILEIHQ